MQRTPRTLASLGLAALLACAGTAQADDIKEALEEALKAYNQGDMSGTKENLGYATQLLNEKSADALTKALPAPLPGWEADEAQSSSAGAALFGGGLQASRTYNKDDHYIEVEIVGDSPMLSQMMVVMTNPALAGSMGKSVKIGKQRGIQDENGKIMLIINNRFMVSVEGDAEQADKLAYAEAVKLEALNEL
ncbi:hypothetical protein SF06_06150 [Pseudomonas flexibilis]|uniref:Uncharacterized protein n=1 Tax=Pseudomonas flexibilis TaxID=706570 RepID=A0A1N6VTF7_9PSED|nr:hypothetical protein [Pseudomonas flexibilis]KHL70531.1 hypothetical protein SF06_06150 [Pseudomonas flexibilis]SIQ81070.1 hypothetical protein SAMN05421672_110100 [Pseudomonas flexibilis]